MGRKFGRKESQCSQSEFPVLVDLPSIRPQSFLGGTWVKSQGWREGNIIDILPFSLSHSWVATKNFRRGIALGISDMGSSLVSAILQSASVQLEPAVSGPPLIPLKLSFPCCSIFSVIFLSHQAAPA